MVVGNQIGNSTAQEVVLKSIPVPMYRHNSDSFQKMWDLVGAETSTKWEASTQPRTFEEMGRDAKDHAWMEEGVGVIEFVVKRTA
jgi:hypothetical protein